MGIVKYFNDCHGNKMFDVAQALADSEWNLLPEQLESVSGIKLEDRTKDGYIVTISKVTYGSLFEMFFVYFEEGGWLCLDHAIEQFGPVRTI